MILLLTVCGIAGLATGRLVGWMARRRRAEALALAAPQQAPSDADVGRPVIYAERLEGFPCQLGDVVLLAHGEEAWLAGGLLFGERASHADESRDVYRTVAALFVAPDSAGARERAVYARPAPDFSLDWMWPVASGALTVGHEPPSVIELGGERFERVRRLPLGVRRDGAGAPDVGSAALVSEYEAGAGLRLLLVIAERGTWAWRGQRLLPGTFDVLPSGRATLDA